MARGDSISNIVAGNSSAYTYITPGSGEEWMITAIGDSRTETYLEMTTDNGSNWLAMYGSEAGSTATSQYIALNDTMSRELHWIITENDRIRSYNASAYHILWYMGIKIKD